MANPVTKQDVFLLNVHAFNVKILEWKMPYNSGKKPERRRSIHAVNDDNGKIYIFGGYADVFVGASETHYLNDMIILDTSDMANLIWSYGSKLYAPTNSRSDHTATMLKTGVIVYIGGFELTTSSTLQLVNINQINLYDTKLGTWSAMV